MAYIITANPLIYLASADHTLYPFSSQIFRKIVNMSCRPACGLKKGKNV
ncbi:hypothetical protein HRbin02_01385 [Candidatus Calditenuaceae archaeon HR02]|nr:hypothetical protein HRbin02_01385 [Candidatus Calditenuaceae archaeon HR02]